MNFCLVSGLVLVYKKYTGRRWGDGRSSTLENQSFSEKLGWKEFFFELVLTYIVVFEQHIVDPVISMQNAIQGVNTKTKFISW